MWYSTKTTMELIQNIYAKYARIYATYMAANNERLRSPYNGKEQLEGLIKRLNKCAGFGAEANELVSETQLARITYGLVSDMFQYPKDCWAWRTLDNKYWTDFQAHFIKAQADIQERQQTSRQGRYVSNNLVEIEQAFENLVQSTVKYRTLVTNITGANMNLTMKVAYYANHMATKDSSMAKMQKKIIQLQG